jgi:hypothetical protein
MPRPERVCYLIKASAISSRPISISLRELRDSFSRAADLSLDVEAVMSSMRFERRMRWATGALMLLLVHALALSRPAMAGCNHLVSSHSNRLLNIHQLDGLITGGSLSPISEDPASPRQPEHPAPCSGPGCSNRMPLPAPTALPNYDRSDQWCVLTTLAFLPSVSPPSRMVDEPAARPSGEKPSIFHPPPA